MDPIAITVDDLREQYQREMALVSATYERTGDGTAAIRRRSAIVDRILIEMWRRAFSGHPGLNVSLVALGGYGRKDLFPYSDIDVLFAFADDKTEEQSRDSVRAMFQGMWDVGLRASPASRTLKEAGRFDPDNLEFTLATLDRRFLAGQFPLYQQLHQSVLPGLILSEWNAIAQKLGEIARARHAKYGNTIFHLEPNLKECPGGLRDYHLAVWFALLFHLKEPASGPASAAASSSRPAAKPKPPSISSPPHDVSFTSATAATTTPSTGNRRTKPPPTPSALKPAAPPIPPTGCALTIAMRASFIAAPRC